MKGKEVMKNRERIVWIVLVAVLLVVTTASGINNWLQAGNTEKTYAHLRLFNEVFNLLRTEYYDETKVQPEKLIPGAIGGMIGTLGDPRVRRARHRHRTSGRVDNSYCADRRYARVPCRSAGGRPHRGDRWRTD
jgi:C-terminal processing protease CtpA/Prc